MSGVLVPNRSLAYVPLSGPTVLLRPDMVSVITRPTGREYRAVSMGTRINVERRTYQGSPYVLVGTKTVASGHPQAAIVASGAEEPEVHYNDAGTIHRWNLEDGSVTTIGTGSYPRAAWNPQHGLQLRVRWRSGDLRAEMVDARGNSISGEQVIATVAECASDCDWHADGTPYVQYPSGGSIVEVRSFDNGRTWV